MISCCVHYVLYSCMYGLALQFVLTEIICHMKIDVLVHRAPFFFHYPL